MRINSYLAKCGLASRRNCEAFVLEGRVKKNGRPVTELSTEVSNSDIITVDGEKVALKEQHVYLMLHKPKGYVCTTSDEKDRKTVLDLIPAYRDRRIFPIGRLDYNTEGLLLLTTDGDAANRLSHPSANVSKTYIAKIEGEISQADLEKLSNGVVLDGVKTKKCSVSLLEFTDNISRIEVILTEGRNKQVRRMFECINKEVIFLKRVAVGALKLGGVSRGKYRPLTAKEISYIKSL